MDRKYKNDEITKLRALELFDSNRIEDIEVGTSRGLQEIHYELCKGIEGYDAGKVRTVNIAKDQFRFASAIYLPQALETISQMPEEQFDQIIEKYVEMNIAHPFLEGNGRATRIWLDMILKKNLGKCIGWVKINKQEY